MNKFSSIIIKKFIIIFFIFLNTEAYAISPGGIIKAFKGMGQLFKKGADELPDVGRKIEDLRSGDLKDINKIDEKIVSPSTLEEASNIKFNEATLSEVENLNKDELLEAHNIRLDRKKGNADQLMDIIDGIDTIGDIAQTAIISPFIKYEWQGKVFRNSEYFNIPNVENKILILCNLTLEDFYFTALFDKNRKSWFLLSGNFTNKKKGIFKKPMERQELLVLEDEEEYLYFSNKPKGVNKFPTKYFMINEKAKFISEINISENTNPNILIGVLKNKIENSSNYCERKL